MEEIVLADTNRTLHTADQFLSHSYSDGLIGRLTAWENLVLTRYHHSYMHKTPHQGTSVQLSGESVGITS